MTKLTETIIQEWYRDSKKIYCQKIVESIPKRAQEMLKSKAGHIN